MRLMYVILFLAGLIAIAIIDLSIMQADVFRSISYFLIGG